LSIWSLLAVVVAARLKVQVAVRVVIELALACL
jgi:hypothetical protein